MTYDDMPSTGVSKVLVLPIDFEDFPADNLPGGKDNYLKYLENSFLEAKKQQRGIRLELSIKNQVMTNFTLKEKFLIGIVHQNLLPN